MLCVHPVGNFNADRGSTGSRGSSTSTEPPRKQSSTMPTCVLNLPRLDLFCAGGALAMDNIEEELDRRVRSLCARVCVCVICAKNRPQTVSFEGIV